MSPPDSSAAKVACDRASASLDLRRYADALKFAKEAIAHAPREWRGHALLSRSFLGLNDNGSALRAAEGGLGLSPDNEWLHRLRSIALVGLRRYPEALSAADEAAKLAPELGLAHYTRSRALEKLGRMDDARAAARRAVELDASDCMLRRNLGDLFLDREPKVAEGHYREALKLDARDALTLNNLGVALNKQGRRKEAAVAFKSAVIADPGLRVARVNTHETISGMMTKGGLPLVGLIIGANVVRILARAGVTTFAIGIGLAIGVFFAALVVAGIWASRSKTKRELETADPQLMEIFEKLDRDKKAGRL